MIDLLNVASVLCNCSSRMLRCTATSELISLNHEAKCARNSRSDHILDEHAIVIRHLVFQQLSNLFSMDTESRLLHLVSPDQLRPALSRSTIIGPEGYALEKVYKAAVQSP